MFRILIAGDRYFLPELIDEEIKKRLSGKYELETVTVQFPYPEKEFPLYKTTVVPSGMSVEDPNKEKPRVEGIREFYGNPDLLLPYVKDIDMIVVHGAPIPRETIDAANRLKCIVAMRGGPVNIDGAYLEEKGIPVYHTSGKNAQSVAEMAIGLVISFLRTIPFGVESLKKDVWPLRHSAYETTGTEICGKTFGIIGFGAIGKRLSKILHGFEADVMAYDPYQPDEVFKEYGVDKAESVDQIIENCDFVTLHARLPKGAPPIIGARELKMMKKSAILINTARGAQLDYKALKEALENHWIRGACLDVLGPEEFGFYDELIALPNIIVTPHMAGCSQETIQRAVTMTVAQIGDILDEMGVK